MDRKQFPFAMIFWRSFWLQNRYKMICLYDIYKYCIIWFCSKIYNIYIWYYVHSYFTSRSSSKHQFGGILKLRQRSPQTLSSDARMEFKTAVANLGWTEFFGERYAIGEMGQIFCPDLKRQENPRWLPLDPKTKVAVSYSRWCFQRFLLAILKKILGYLVKWSHLTSKGWNYQWVELKPRFPSTSQVDSSRSDRTSMILWKNLPLH